MITLSLSLFRDLVPCVRFFCVDANMFRQASVSEVRARQQMGRAVTFASSLCLQLWQQLSASESKLHVLKKKKKKRHVSALLLVPPAQTNFMCSLKHSPPPNLDTFVQMKDNEAFRGSGKLS